MHCQHIADALLMHCSCIAKAAYAAGSGSSSSSKVRSCPAAVDKNTSKAHCNSAAPGLLRRPYPTGECPGFLWAVHIGETALV